MDKEGFKNKFMSATIDLSRELKEKFPEILGISISGSVACDNADEYSDIDLDIWLSDEVHQKWLFDCPLMQYFEKYSILRETPSNFSFGIGNEYKFDITILSIGGVEKNEWKIEQKATRHNSVIIVDSDDVVKNLLSKKLNVGFNEFISKEEYDVTVPNSEDYYKFYISAYLNYHIPVAIARKKFEQAHFNLTWATNLLVELLWTIHNRYYPYMKSRWFIVDYLSEEEKSLLAECQFIKEHSEEDVERRRALIRKLYKLLGYEEVTFYHEKLDLS